MAVTATIAASFPFGGRWAHAIIVAAAAASVVVQLYSGKPPILRQLAYVAILLNVPEANIGIRAATVARFALGIGIIADLGACERVISVVVSVWVAATAIYEGISTAILYVDPATTAVATAAVSVTAWTVGAAFSPRNCTDRASH